jgi:hypothetical protein
VCDDHALQEKLTNLTTSMTELSMLGPQRHWNGKILGPEFTAYLVGIRATFYT